MNGFEKWWYGDEEPDVLAIESDEPRRMAKEVYDAATAAERERWIDAIRRVKNHYQLRGGPVLLEEALKLLEIASRKEANDE